MTNKEAIRVLKSTSINFSRMGGKTAYVEALEMAITALNQLDNNSTKPDNSTATQSNGIESKVKGLTACRVPEDDTISRRQAIDAFEDTTFTKKEIFRRLSELPSVQLEIIRCKDCKHRGEKPIADGRYWCELHDTFMYYCSDAERRTDEPDK